MEAHAAASVVLTLLGVAALAAYALALLRLRRPWPTLRTAAFAAGIALALLSVSLPMAERAAHDARAHMAAHVLLGMIAPLGIVLGRPATLALRALPRRGARALVAIARAPLLRALAHPWVALVPNVGGMALLYLTPLYVAMHGSLPIQIVVHVHFVLAGSLFAWSIAGLERIGPRPSSHVARLGALFVGAAAHATLARAMYAYGFPRTTAHDAVELEEAAKIMYYGGDAAELLLAIVIFARWPWRAPRADASSHRAAGAPSGALARATRA